MGVQEKKSLQGLFDETLEEITRAHRICLVIDDAADGGSVGSLLALCLWLRRMDKEVCCLGSGTTPFMFSHLAGIERITETVPTDPLDIVIALQCNTRKPLYKELMQHQPEALLIILDAHENGKGRGEIRIVGTAQSSIIELVYSFFMHSNIDIDRKMAECLLTGLLFDTEGFANKKVFPETLLCAAKLAEAGARLHVLWHRMQEKKDPKKAPLFGEVTLRAYRHNNFLITTVGASDYEKHDAEPNDFFGYEKILAKTANIQGAGFITEGKNSPTKGVIRMISKSDISATNIAKKFGGVGNKHSAQFETTDSLENALQKLLKYIDLV